MAGPSVSYSGCAFDEKNLGISFLDPFLGEEIIQAFLKGLAYWRALINVVDCLVRIFRPNSQDKSDGCPLFAAGGIRNGRAVFFLYLL